MHRFPPSLLICFLMLSCGASGCVSESPSDVGSDFDAMIESQHLKIADLTMNQTEQSIRIEELLTQNANLTDSLSDAQMNLNASSNTTIVDETERGHSSLEVQFSFDLERTAENPLRGFYTNYAWGDPVIEFPDSLEFAYIPLSDMMSGPSNFTFDTGLEPRLLAAESRAHQLVLRPYIDYPTLESGLPAFLADKVEMRSYTEHGGGQSPDYDNPHLQASLISFIEAMGQQYDGDSRLGIVQLGLLGFWGEWHTWPHNDWFPNSSFQSELIIAYTTAFKQTLLQIRYPVAGSSELPIGFHDDSFAHSTLGDADWYFHPRLVAAKAEERWRENPIGGELRPELQWWIFEDGYSTGTDRQDFFECVSETHASMLLNFAAFSGGLNSTTELERAEAAALSLGYALHVSSASVNASLLQVTLENRGVAPFYHSLMLQVQDSNGMIATVELPRLTRDHGSQVFVLNISTFLNPSPEAPWTLSLHSDNVLQSQQILFATAPGEGSIRVM